MATIDWRGVMPALTTEMNQDGSLHLKATAQHAESCLSAGVEGIVVLGTLGENNSLTLDEKEAVTHAVVEVVNGRVPVIAGVAEYTSTFAIDAMRRAESAGADGFMLLPSMVYQQDSREAIAHFSSLAESTDLPIMIYNNRVSYKVDLTPEDFMQLSNHDNIVAVKESSHDSRRMTDMINTCGDRYLMFCGVDDLALENFIFGAVGWVSGMANAFPKETAQIFKFAKSERIEEALSLYRWLMPVLHLDCGVKLVQQVKLANQLTGLGSEWVRPPRLPLDGQERAIVERIVQTAVDNSPVLAV